jgi:DNA-binding NarL/FixJ family response regulator
MKVFLVEDAPLLRERLAALIDSVPGASTVGHAAGAQEAIQAIHEAAPDAVVLDLHLHQGNGFEVLRALQKSAPQIDVYVVTNFANDSYRQAATRLGARGFFDKSTEFDKPREALASRTG